MERGAGLISASVAVCGLLCGNVAWAQANDEVDAGIQFNFSLPGARSMAMGGAFLASADDATAAFTNPAGLTILRSPEVSVEGRYFDFDNRFIAGGHAPGRASGVPPDTHTGLLMKSFDDSTLGVSFASVVIPRGRWSFAFYRHELANFEANGMGGGEFVSAPGCEYVNPEAVCRRVFFTAGLDLEIASYGLSAAYRFSDRFSVGIGAAYHDASLDGRTDRYDPKAPDGSVFHGNPPNYDSSLLVASTIQHVDDAAPAATIGFVWKATDWLGVGGVWRQGPSFDFEGRVVQGPYLINICPTCFRDVEYRSRYHVPDVYGLGFVVRPREIPLRVALDVNRVRYSQIIDGFVNIVGGIANDESFAAGTPAYYIEDATEVRLGAEYVFADGRAPVAVRLGGWYDPDHRLKNTGVYLPAEKTRFAGGDDEIHATAGLGLVLGKRFQIDAAFDHSRFVDAVSVSAVLFF